IPGAADRIREPIRAILERGEDFDGALKLIASALEILPTDVELYWFRGYALRQLGRLREAADSYQRASQIASRISIIPAALAQTFLELREYPRAIEAALRAAEIAPDSADAHALVARSQHESGNIPAAFRAAQRAMDLDPVHGDAIWLTFLAHLKLG